MGKVKGTRFNGGYSVVKQYVRGRKEVLNEQATVRFETIPGWSGRLTHSYAVILTLFGIWAVIRKNRNIIL